MENLSELKCPYCAESASRNRKKMTLDEIKMLHGCTTVKTKTAMPMIANF